MKIPKLPKKSRTNVGIVQNAILLFLCSSLMLTNVTQLYSGGGPNVNGAKLYIQLNELDKALNVLMKEINERDPKNEDAWYLLGYVYARQQNYEKMMAAFDKAVELKPKFKEKGLKISKDKGAILSSGSVIVSQLGVDMIKRAIWQNAFTIGVNNFNDAINTTDEAERIKKYESAIEQFKVSAFIIPDSVYAYKNMSAAYWNLGKHEESISPLLKAIELKPDNVEIKVMLAQSYSIVQKDSLAIPILEDLWAKGVRTAEVSDNLSRAYTLTGQTDKAKEIYKVALNDNPDNFKLITNYGSMLFNIDDFDGALEQFKKAHELQPESLDANFNLGYAYFKRGLKRNEALKDNFEDSTHVDDFQTSYPYLIKAIQKNPDDRELWLILGNVAGRIDKISLAGYAFSKSEGLDVIMDNKVYVGMQAADLKLFLGEPDQVKTIEADIFNNVEEWIYQANSTGKRKVELANQLNVYVENGRVEALYQFN